ncbi:L-rhamnose mutarotase [Sphingobacterium sp. HMA12]|uniref:L-rhamnose mutarotase n=1 Tax=Sphingobacterium sp. HMA12 TaxID=2050894 RepID=UPI000CE9EE6A|nr:L-rhamnose mutarotase [Sphingobacterium sp. HMA12]
MKQIVLISVFIMFSLWAFSAQCGEIYVGKQSKKEQRDGSSEAPFSNLEDALREAREWRRLQDPRMQHGITIWVRDAVYAPAQTILIRPEDSGTAQSPTRIKAEGRNAVFSGGISVTDWRLAKSEKRLDPAIAKHIMVADAPQAGGKYFPFRQLWVGSRKAVRAESHDDAHLPRIINWDFNKQAAIIPNVLPKAFSYKPGMEFFIHQWWAVAQLRIRDAIVTKDSITLLFHEPEGKIQNEHPWPKPWLSKEHGNSAFRLVNALEFLDQPGEWFLDEESHKVYYYKRPDENLEQLQVIAPYLETILTMQGTLEVPVRHVYIEGLQFQHSSWLRPHNYGHVALQAGMYFLDAYKLAKPGTRDKAGLENQAWLGRPQAAITLSHTAFTRISACRFSHLAATGIDYRQGNLKDSLIGNLFQDIGGSGVLLGQFSDEQVEAHLPFQPSDGRILTDGVVVSNNLIQDIGNEDWGTVGIGAGFVRNVSILHNELLDLPYTGISLGWGWTPTVNAMRNNRVFKNKITRYGKYMYDVAGIYTLSAQPGTKIQENYIDSIYMSPYAHIPDHWFYLYTDEGSAYMNVSNNWFPTNKILKNANGPGVEWHDNGPDAAAEVPQQAGIQSRYLELLKAKKPWVATDRINSYVPFTKPVFFQIHNVKMQLEMAEIKDFFARQGADSSQVYRWKDYILLMTDDEIGKKISSAWIANYPAIPHKLFNDLFYTFDRSSCGGKVKDTDFVLLTAQLVDDKSKQEAYYNAHKTQFKEWPEVAAGFCKAGFDEVLVYRNGRQLMLYISFPKGQDFKTIDQLTTKGNPRVIEWNKLMGSYQEGIPGTEKDETWIFYKQ